MSHRVVRASKFRNVYGTAWKREQCYDNIRVSKSSWDSTFCSVNPKFAAIIVDSAGGGSFIVLPLDKEKVGKIKSDHPVVSGHKGPVLDIAWCVHDDHLIASGSEDCSVKVWEIPEGGLTKTLTEPLVALLFHQRRVGLVLWHPTAENVLLTAGSDNLVVIWDVGKGSPNIVIGSHPDLVYSASWNWDGSRFLTTCRDKKIRIYNPRTGEIEEEAICHEGSKACRALFLKGGEVFTTGFSKVSERQYSLRTPGHMSDPLVMTEIDTSNGVMFPMYDPDTNMVYLCGKGDSVIRYFEVTEEPPFVHYISTFQSPDPQRGIGMLPKRGCDVTVCEIARFFRLNSSGLCQVVSMTVPRKSELFQEDLYPSTVSPIAALTAEDWFSGIDQQPIMMSIRTGCQISVSEDQTEGAKKQPSNQPADAHLLELRRSSRMNNHELLSKTQSFPMEARNVTMKDHSALVDEVAQLRSLVTLLEKRVQVLEGASASESSSSCCATNASSDTAPSSPVAAAPSCAEALTPKRVAAESFLSSGYGATLSSFLSSPVSSLTALSAQLPSPLSSAYSLAMPAVHAVNQLKAVTALRQWASPLESISSFSSSLLSSFSPVHDSPRWETKKTEPSK